MTKGIALVNLFT